MVNPLDSKAPMSTVPLTMRGEPRWSVVTPLGMRALLPASMAGLAGQQGHCLGRAAVIAPRISRHPLFATEKAHGTGRQAAQSRLHLVSSSSPTTGGKGTG